MNHTESLMAGWNEFCVKELLTCGPDSHIELAVAAAVLDPANKAWRVACYIAPYMPSTGAAVWSHWPTAALVLQHQDHFRSWVVGHKSGLGVRQDRRSVQNADHLADCFIDLAHWVTDELPRIWNEPYEVQWKSAMKIRYVGRFMAMKVLESLRQAGCVENCMPDIRPHDAKYPRKMLGTLYPDYKDHVDIKGNLSATLELANALAAHAETMLDQRVSWYQLEVLLCNFRQGIGGRYPGRTHDSDRKYYVATEAYWGEDALDFPIWDLRKQLFPHECLGEIQGWDIKRDDLKWTWRDHGYFWCDLIYDYNSTTDYGNPVRQSKGN